MTHAIGVGVSRDGKGRGKRKKKEGGGQRVELCKKKQTRSHGADKCCEGCRGRRMGKLKGSHVQDARGLLHEELMLRLSSGYRTCYLSQTNRHSGMQEAAPAVKLFECTSSVASLCFEHRDLAWRASSPGYHDDFFFFAALIKSVEAFSNPHRGSCSFTGGERFHPAPGQWKPTARLHSACVASCNCAADSAIWLRAVNVFFSFLLSSKYTHASLPANTLLNANRTAEPS